jgi:hypothetical protein
VSTPFDQQSYEFGHMHCVAIAPISAEVSAR